ncbi:hypothetical protein [Bacillus pseudomycoides]|uniref:hypothetical protein n=1 Tax=Bacillus pseudomycoides TaxID=64104 RepID=UPI000BFD158B|nr:hypothetical protein [Bacillus pseudomycoides]PHE46906.1 hypothetical protein COF53_14770 [Bacillus pseudomycoides]
MNFNLGEITQNIVSQIAFIIMVIMAARSLFAYIRQDWGAFFSQLCLGVLCLVVVFFGPQIQEIARAVGDSFFK